MDVRRGMDEDAARAWFFRETRRLPTGEQFAIRHGDRTAVITEVGATLREFTVAGVPFVDGFAADAMAGSRGAVLLPWPNRIAGGTYSFGEQAHQLPLTEPGKGNASHGLVLGAHWSLLAQTPARVALAYLLHPQRGYPFLLACEVAYSLSDAGLRVETVARNLGGAPAPFGAGNHPYFTVGTAFVDSALLHVPAATRYETDDRSIPTARATVAGTPFDFRTARAIGPLHIDTGYTDIEPGTDGWRRITLARPGGPRLTVAMDGAYRYAQIFTGDTLPPAAQRRGLAIEPMTCAANAFNSGDGLRTLVPGETWRGVWSVSVA